MSSNLPEGLSRGEFARGIEEALEGSRLEGFRLKRLRVISKSNHADFYVVSVYKTRGRRSIFVKLHHWPTNDRFENEDIACWGEHNPLLVHTRETEASKDVRGVIGTELNPEHYGASPSVRLITMENLGKHSSKKNILEAARSRSINESSLGQELLDALINPLDVVATFNGLSRHYQRGFPPRYNIDGKNFETSVLPKLFRENARRLAFHTSLLDDVRKRSTAPELEYLLAEMDLNFGEIIGNLAEQEEPFHRKRRLYHGDANHLQIVGGKVVDLASFGSYSLGKDVGTMLTIIGLQNPAAILKSNEFEYLIDRYISVEQIAYERGKALATREGVESSIDSMTPEELKSNATRKIGGVEKREEFIANVLYHAYHAHFRLGGSYARMSPEQRMSSAGDSSKKLAKTLRRVCLGIKTVFDVVEAYRERGIFERINQGGEKDNFFKDAQYFAKDVLMLPPFLRG